MAEEKRKIIATYMPANLDACALYRMFIPSLNIPNARFVFRPGRQLLEDVAGCDVVVVQRQSTVNNFVALQRLREFGLKIVYDLDDNLWAIPAYNPAKEVFKELREGLMHCIKLCDVVTVSTQGLRSAVKSEVGGAVDIVIVPNAMDFNLFKPPSIVTKDTERIVIGWAGSNTHKGDVTEAWAALEDVVLENENVYLELIGEDPPDKLYKHPRVKARPWVPVGEFMGKFCSWKWDIIIAPLSENRFNRSKSNIKLLEAAAVGAAILASDVQPYNEFCSLSPVLKHALCSHRKQWKTKLQELVSDGSLRDSNALEARRVAESFYDIKALRSNWEEVFRKVCLP